MTLRATYLVLGSLAALAVSGSVPAFAEEAACGCAVQSSAAGPIGSVIAASGNVMVSQAAGYSEARQGSALTVGSRVITGVKSSAAVRLSSGCGVDLGANSSATLVRQEDKICLQVTKPETAADAEFSSGQKTFGQSGPQQPNGFGFPEFFFGAAFTAGAAGYAFDDRDDERPGSDQ